MKNIGRNQPCPCGSGKKYKKCCALKSPLQRRQFTNRLSGEGQSTLSKLSGMVSKNLSSTPSASSNSKAELLKNRVNQKKTNEKDIISKNAEQEKPKE